MPNAKSHANLEPEKYALVAQDGIAREAKHRTTYDDDSTAETIHMLYRDGANVRSCLLSDWPAEQQAQAARDAERAAYKASREALRTTAQGLVGQSLADLSTHEVRDLFALFLEQEGLLDADGKVLRDRRFGPKPGWE